MKDLIVPLLKRDHSSEDGIGMLHRLELHRPLELLNPLAVPRKARKALLGSRLLRFLRGSPSEPTPAVLLLNALSDGRRVKLAGQLLRQTLPEAQTVTALKTFFARDKQTVGQLEVERRHQPGLALASLLSTDSTGAFLANGTVDPPLPPGQYTLRWRSPQGDRLEGHAVLRVLDREFRGPIITSDIDQTYLLTDFHSTRGVVKLLQEVAHHKHPYPGIATLYRHLQGLGPEHLPTLFLSASPTFFGPVFAARLALDQVRYDAILLKPLDQVLRSELRRGNVRGLKKALTDQLSYKLGTLLEQRLLYPASVREILIGDDTEDDPLIFSLYRGLLTEGLELEMLRQTLARHGSLPHKQDKLVALARAVRIHQQGVAPEVDVYIHRLNPAPPGEDEARVGWFRDSLALARLLEARGDLQPEGVRAIEEAMLAERS